MLISVEMNIIMASDQLSERKIELHILIYDQASTLV